LKAQAPERKGKAADSAEKDIAAPAKAAGSAAIVQLPLAKVQLPLAKGKAASARAAGSAAMVQLPLAKVQPPCEKGRASPARAAGSAAMVQQQPEKDSLLMALLSVRDKIALPTGAKLKRLPKDVKARAASAARAEFGETASQGSAAKADRAKANAVKASPEIPSLEIPSLETPSPETPSLETPSLEILRLVKPSPEIFKGATELQEPKAEASQPLAQEETDSQAPIRGATADKAKLARQGATADKAKPARQGATANPLGVTAKAISPAATPQATGPDTPGMTALLKALPEQAGLAEAGREPQAPEATARDGKARASRQAATAPAKARAAIKGKQVQVQGRAASRQAALESVLTMQSATAPVQEGVRISNETTAAHPSQEEEARLASLRLARRTKRK
jgi:hypothetical protein